MKQLWSRLTLASRLAGLFALLAMLGFGVSGLALQHYLGVSAAHERHHALQTKLDVVARMVDQRRRNGAPLDMQWPALRAELDTLHQHDLSTHYWVLCSQAGVSHCDAPHAALQVAAQGRGWQHVPFAAVGVSPLGEWSGPTLQVHGRRLPPGADGSEVVVLIGGDEAGAYWTLHRFAWVIAAFTLAGGLLTSLLGWCVARWGLRPLAALADQAADLGPKHLTLRLPALGSAPELLVLTQAFNGALERLEAAYHQLESFNADVAHELRSPLSVLIGEAEVALGRPRNAAQWSEMVAGHLEALRQMATMVGDMLFLARADHGERAADQVEADLPALAQQTLDFFEPLAGERGLALDLVLDPAAAPGAGAVRGNPALLKRALSNLVANAIQYGDAAGPIRIEIQPADDRCALLVSNAGAPLPEPMRRRMFDRFYRADAARRQHASHHGLGLSIVRAVALMHGGSVFADSAAGRVRVGMLLPRSGAGWSMQGG